MKFTKGLLFCALILSIPSCKYHDHSCARVQIKLNIVDSSKIISYHFPDGCIYADTTRWGKREILHPGDTVVGLSFNFNEDDVDYARREWREAWNDMSNGK